MTTQIFFTSLLFTLLQLSLQNIVNVNLLLIIYLYLLLQTTEKQKALIPLFFLEIVNSMHFPLFGLTSIMLIPISIVALRFKEIFRFSNIMPCLSIVAYYIFYEIMSAIYISPIHAYQNIIKTIVINCIVYCLLERLLFFHKKKNHQNSGS